MHQHTLANLHYMAEADQHEKAPNHWSGPAERYMGQVNKLHEAMAEGIRRSPEPFRETMAAMHAEILQLRRMVSEGVILGLVRKEFWEQYAQVPVQVEDFVNITEATIQLFEELFKRGDLKADPEIRAKINEAVGRTREARKALVA